MQLSNEGLAFIARHEGLRLKAYRDPVGIWTIGHGHTGRASPPPVFSGMTITAAEARTILKRDIRPMEQSVSARTRHLAPLNQHEFDALVSFAFNLGPGNLRRLVQDRDRKTIAAKMLQYDRAGSRRLRGLTKRRRAERAMFLRPIVKSPDGMPGAPQQTVGKVIAITFAAICLALAAWLGWGG